jgi:DNA-directed RNA polymerase subunit N (RpoN/RPB10)
LGGCKVPEYDVTARYTVAHKVKLSAKNTTEAKWKAYNQLISINGINEEIAKVLEELGLELEQTCHHLFWDIEKTGDDNNKKRRRRR